MAIAGRVASEPCNTWIEPNTEANVHQKIREKYGRMNAFVSNAYALIEPANQQINWEEAEYAGIMKAHTKEISDTLRDKKRYADGNLLELERNFLKDFCPDEDPEDFKYQMNVETYGRFETEAAYRISGMMQTRYDSGINVFARLYSEKSNPTKFVTVVPLGWLESVALYNFDEYCKVSKAGFDRYIRETNEHVDKARQIVLSFVGESTLPDAEKTMLRSAVEHQVNEFNRKVEHTKLCDRPAEEQIRDQGRIVAVVHGRIIALEAAMRHQFSLVLMRELQNVSHHRPKAKKERVSFVAIFLVYRASPFGHICKNCRCAMFQV